MEWQDAFTPIVLEPQEYLNALMLVFLFPKSMKERGKIEDSMHEAFKSYGKLFSEFDISEAFGELDIRRRDKWMDWKHGV